MAEATTTEARMRGAVRPMGVGVVGCGVISEAYLHTLSGRPEVRLVACADLDQAAARRRAEAFGLRALGVDALLADPDVELVLNLTPPGAHVPVGLAAVEAGRHVYSEKPLGVTAAEGRALLAAAERRGVRVGCAPDTFLGGAHQTARALVDAGAIGRPVAGTAAFMNHGHEGWHPDPGFYYAAGGGPMLDMGPYYVTALVSLLGPVARVSGAVGTGQPERVVGSGPKAGAGVPVEVATHLAAVLEFAGGAVVTLITSFDVWRHDVWHMEIHGTEGSLRATDPNRFDGAVRLSRRGADWEEMPTTHAHAEGEHRGLGLADMAAAIREGRAHRADGALALHVLEVMEAVEASWRAGRHVGIEGRCARPASLAPLTEEA